jgi:opacity protein-like surface antigen
MMKKVLNLVTVAGLALTAAASAHAQVPSILGSGDIKVGIFNPSSHDARDNGGSTQFSVGADYTTPGVPGAPRPTFYGDYQGGSKSGGHVNTYGIGVATKYTQGIVGALTKATPYAGIGVGVYRVDVKNTSNGESGTNTTIGGKVFAGVTFNKYVLEANYQFLPSEKGVNPSGFGVQVGVTF